MSRIIKFAKTIRRNWKKSTIAFAALSYGIYYGCDRYKTFQMMRAYCEEARVYGLHPTSPLEKQRHVTVILNPVAQKNKAKVQFEKYAAPLLYLAGLKVSLIQTENEGQTIDLMEIMDNTDAVIIAGGNGTVHEAVTGLLRRPEYENNITYSMPIGIIPVGQTNTVAKVIFGNNSTNKAQLLANAAMAIVKNETVLVDVLKVEMEENKPLFALSGFEFGSFPDLEKRMGKYWYFGPLRDKIAYFMNSFQWKYVGSDAELEYLAPCEGCSQCYAASLRNKRNEPKRWWTVFLPRQPTVAPLKDYSKVINSNCGIWNEQKATCSNLMISTTLRNFNTLEPSDKAFWIRFYPKELSMSQFMRIGLDYHKGHLRELYNPDVLLSAREAKLCLNDSIERVCYIDTEKYDVKPTHITLLPKHLVLYGTNNRQ